MAKKSKGLRATKANDSFGTINDDNLYKNKYHKDLDKDDDDNEVEQEAQVNPETESATSQDTSFVQAKIPEEVDFKKRYDDLKKHYDQKLDTWKTEKSELENAIKNSVAQHTDVPMPKTPEELEEFKQSYPDVYAVVQTVAHQQAEEQSKDLHKELETIREREKTLVVQKAYEELLRKHPDFDGIKKDEKFLKWLETQPASLSDGIYKNNTDALWASRVIDLYKVDSGLGKKSLTKARSSAASAITPAQSREVRVDSNAGKRIWKTSEIQNLKSWEFEELEKEIDAARAEGRIDFST